MAHKQNLGVPDLDNESQDEFWRDISPDIREAMEMFEAGEDWTYDYDEFPELFIATARLLPGVLEIPVNDEHKKLLTSLIPLLSSMPFRQSIAALSWIDNHDDGGPGWGAACFAEATKIVNAGPSSDESLYAHAKIICERIKTLVKFNLVSALFLHHKEFE